MSLLGLSQKEPGLGIYGNASTNAAMYGGGIDNYFDPSLLNNPSPVGHIEMGGLPQRTVQQKPDQQFSTWLNQLFGTPTGTDVMFQQATQPGPDPQAAQAQQQASDKLAQGYAAMQGLASQLTVNPLQTLQTNPLINPSQLTPQMMGSLMNAGPGAMMGALAGFNVPTTVSMGALNAITDPALQGVLQSLVQGTGTPYNSWMAHQQLINPVSGGWNFGVGLS